MCIVHTYIMSCAYVMSMVCISFTEAMENNSLVGWSHWYVECSSSVAVSYLQTFSVYLAIFRRANISIAETIAVVVCIL